MKNKKKFPHSLRKYLRKQKASIRFNVLDIKEKQEKIKKLYNELVSKNKKQ